MYIYMFSITCLKGKEEKGQKLPSWSAIYVLIYVSIISLTTYFSSDHSCDYGFQKSLNGKCIGKLEEATMSVL